MATQRAAADFLVREYGIERIEAVIRLLPKTNNIPYFPTITSPEELKERWVKLEGAFARKKKELTTSKGRGLA